MATAITRYVEVRRQLFVGAKAAGAPFEKLWEEKNAAFAELVAIEGGAPFTGHRGPFLEDGTTFASPYEQRILDAARRYRIAATRGNQPDSDFALNELVELLRTTSS